MCNGHFAGCLAALLVPLGSLSAGIADLGIAQGPASISVSFGMPLTCTVTVQNFGPDAARDVLLTDMFPAAARLISAQSDFGSCTQVGNTVICHLDSLAAGAAATLTLTLAPTCTGTFCNFARVTSGARDPTLTNNRVSVCTIVTRPNSGADLSVSVVAIPDAVPVGSNVAYTLRVRNNGPDAATGIRWVDTLPTNATFISASPDCTNSNGVVSCNITTLSKNASVAKTIVLAPTIAGPLCHAVSVLGNEPDPSGDNNNDDLCVVATTTLRVVQDLAVLKITAPPTVVLSEKKPSAVKLVSVQIQNRSPHAETISRLDNLVNLSVESLGLCSDRVAELVIGSPQRKLPVTLNPRQTLNVYFGVTFDTNCVNDPLKSSITTAGHEDYRYSATVHHEAINGQPDTHPGDDFGPRSVRPPSETVPNPDGKLQDRGVGKLKSDHTFGADITTDLIAPGPGTPVPTPPTTNRPPVAVDDRASTTRTNPVNIFVLANDSDPDGDTLNVINYTQPANGAVAFTGNVARYAANAGFVGTDRLNYTISDGRGGNATAPVTITVSTLPNRPPMALNDSANTTATNPITVEVLVNDRDPDDDTLAVIGFTQPANGLVTFSGNVARYAANAGFFGTDSFTYTISDGRDGTANAQVLINVSNLPNRPPIGMNDAAITSGTNPIQIAVLANDSDPDGDTLSVINFTQPANGAATFSSDIATYTANAGFAGTNTFQYTVSDGRGGTATATVSVMVTNPPIWETSAIGAVWSDDFNRAALGPNWIVLGGANVSITGNELLFATTNVNFSRQMYYQPWLTCSDQWTIRWRQRFAELTPASFGVGIGIKNFQAAGGNDRGYNAMLGGAGTGTGKMHLQRWDGSAHNLLNSGQAMALLAGQIVDCSITRSGWTISATASNSANGQVSTASITFSEAANLIAPTISRMCFYPLGGAVYVDDVSFTINHRKPARFIMVGASANDGYNASTFSRTHLSIMQSYFNETVCNDSSSYNSTSNSVSILPEILAHQPDTAILMLGGNDVGFGYPAAQWQAQYANLVAQLQASGVKVKHCLNTPRAGDDLRPLNNWILGHYPAQDVIDTWTPLVQGDYLLNPAYDSGDGLHPNDAGHLLLGQIISGRLQ